MERKLFRCGVIDIGANSVRMNIYDIDGEAGTYAIVTTARNMLGLAALVSGGQIPDRGCDQLIRILRSFLDKAAEFSCRQLLAFATASLRSVSNGKIITEKIRSELGLSVQIITGEEEARYDFSAVSHRFGGELDKRGVVLDMGGGSTEMIAFEDGNLTALASMKIGCLALYRHYVGQKKVPPFPSGTESWNMIRYTRMVIGSKKEFRGYGGTAYLIGGTARTLARLHQRLFDNTGMTDGYRFPAGDLAILKKRILDDMQTGGTLLSEMAGDRMNSIVPGVLAYTEILSFLKVTTVVSCGSGVRDGFLLDFIANRFPKESPKV